MCRKNLEFFPELKKAVADFSTTASYAILIRSLFWKADSTLRANISASAALYACVRIDRILLALRDCSCGAFVDTSTASDAVVANYISHVKNILNCY